MTQIIVKGELRDTLAGLTDRSELRDEKGDFLGIFLPKAYRNIPIFGDLSDEEIQRRRQQPGKYTLAEIWKSLGVAP